MALLALATLAMLWKFRRGSLEIPSSSELPDVVYEGMTLSEQYRGVPQFFIRAGHAAIYYKLNKTELRSVQGDVPSDGDTPSFSFVAASGRYRHALANFQFNHIEVTTHEKNPLLLRTESLDWTPGDAELDCQGTVYISKEKVSGKSAQARANLATGHVTLWNGVHAQIVP